MSETKKQESPTPPYVAYRTFKNFLRTLAQAIPGRIDKSVMVSMSGGTQIQLLHALRYLRLVASNGVPSDKLPLLVKSEGAEYERVLRELLHDAYPFLKGNELELENATTKQLTDQFSKLANGDTVRKCITFFIPAAKDAGMKISPFIKELGKRTRTNGKAQKPRVANTRRQTNAEEKDPPPTPVQNLTWHELLLSKFPSFDPSWPDTVKTQWFAGFKELMQQGQDSKEDDQ